MSENTQKVSYHEHDFIVKLSVTNPNKEMVEKYLYGVIDNALKYLSETIQKKQSFLLENSRAAKMTLLTDIDASTDWLSTLTGEGAEEDIEVIPIDKLKELLEKYDWDFYNTSKILKGETTDETENTRDNT